MLKRFAAFLVLGTLTAACATGSGASSGSVKVIHLRYASLIDATHQGNGTVIKTLIDRANSQSGGRLVVDPFYNGTLVSSEATLLTQLEAGTIDMGIITDATIASIEPSFNLIELPYFWKSQNAQNTVIEHGKIGQTLLQSLEVKGLEGLGFVNNGPRDVLSTFPIQSVSDVRAKKIRVVPNTLFIAQWTAWGANPVALAPAEVITSLATGTVSAVDTNPTGMVTQKWYEAAKHLAVTDHQFTQLVIIINFKAWQSLSADLQQLVRTAVADGETIDATSAAKGNADAIATLQANGVTVTHPDSAGFRDKVQPVWSTFEQSIGSDLVNAATAAQQSLQ
jgi:tripartite ATP-independent transporter DctP family solute receptor